MHAPSFRLALTAMTGFAAGTAITSAAFIWQVFSDDWLVLAFGVVVGGGLVVATILQAADARVAGLAAMLAGLLLLLAGVVEIALVGLTYQAVGGATQPAWLHELFLILAGAVIGGMGIRLWRPSERSTRSSRQHPVGAA